MDFCPCQSFIQAIEVTFDPDFALPYSLDIKFKFSGLHIKTVLCLIACTCVDLQEFE